MLDNYKSDEKDLDLSSESVELFTNKWFIIGVPFAALGGTLLGLLLALFYITHIAIDAHGFIH